MCAEEADWTCVEEADWTCVEGLIGQVLRG